jgi:hypothetical protein
MEQRRDRSGPSPLGIAWGAALAVSAAAWVFFVSRGAHLLHFDAKAHLLVSRRVFDSLTPGWTQLGAVWLPLPHILNALPARSDVLYHTGLFASALGFLAFVLGLLALGRAAAEATGDPWAAVVALAVPALNPGWLYLQATPMTEPLFLAPVSGLALFLVRWRRDRRPRDLMAGCACSGLACLVRYEAWPIAAAALVLAFWIPDGLRLARRFLPLAALVGLVGPIVFVGVHTWVATDRAIYVIDSGNLTERGGNPWSALVLLGDGIAEGFGAGLAVAAVAGLALTVIRPHALSWLAAACAGPAVVTFTAYMAGHPTKTRYALLLAPAVGLALAAATRGRPLSQAAATALAAAQLVTVGPPLPVLREAIRDRRDVAERRDAVAAFRHGYPGGRILASMGSLAPVLFETQLPLREFVHEGTGTYWEYAAVDPARNVRFVLVAPGDVLDQIRAYRPHFPEGFVPVGRWGLVTVYERAGDVVRPGTP